MLICVGQGFLCRDDIALENPANEGCLIQCNMGWKLVADPRNAGHWYCTNISTPICPGKFNTGGSGGSPVTGHWSGLYICPQNPFLSLPNT